jgi:hypothetical protein
MDVRSASMNFIANQIRHESQNLGIGLAGENVKVLF